MKKSVLAKSFIIMLSVLFSLSSCSSKETVIEGDDGEIIIDTEQGKDTNIISIPDAYPNDVIPIYADSHISAVMEANEAYTVLFYSDDELSDVVEYYKNIFKDATNKMETTQSDAYTVYGELEGYTFVFVCGPNTETDEAIKDYKTYLSLNVSKNPRRGRHERHESARIRLQHPEIHRS